MKYRKFGKLDYFPSALGFGAMRLPTTDGSPLSPVIEDEAVRMIRHAIDGGVNYIDTAYVYHDGVSEKVVGNALLDGYREKVKIATKSPVWAIKQPEDFDKFLDEQLSRLKTDHIDFYLLHALSHSRWEGSILKHNLLKKAEDAKKAGKIGHIGFSFHDAFPAFEEIVNGYDNWEFCQIQLNYLNEEHQAGLKGYNLCVKKEIPVIIMEPLLGGKLSDLPAKARAIFDAAGLNPVSAAFDYLWDMPGVVTVLSGMSTLDQVSDNLKHSDAFNGFSKAEAGAIAEVKKYFSQDGTVPCTACQYCMPCPAGVAIPDNLNAYNELKTFDDRSVAIGSRKHIVRFNGERGLSESCTGCGVCEEKCPQHIKISEIMPQISEAFK